MRYPNIITLAVVAVGVYTATMANASPVVTQIVVPSPYSGSFGEGGLGIDSAGNLYALTSIGYGSIVELSDSGHQTVTPLAEFDGEWGRGPWGAPLVDSAGNIYGTTRGNTLPPGTNTLGSVYEISGATHQTFSTLVDFTGPNGSTPWAGLTVDSSGNLYGTTDDGGLAGEGTVFELSGTDHQNFAQLANFSVGTGYIPFTNVEIDGAGNLYGTTTLGGANGDGTVYELSGPNHQTMTTLLNFTTPHTGDPGGQLTVDAAGDVFGTDASGFEISGPNHGTYASLPAPASGLIADADGNLYGTTGTGTLLTVFELSGPEHQTLTTLADISQTGSGNFNGGYLTADASGNLYLENSGFVYEVTGTGFVTAVPEPTSLSLLAVCSAAMLGRRRIIRD